MSIRTTIALDEDVLDCVKAESRHRGEPFRETLNNLLRFAISAHKVAAGPSPFKVRPFGSTGAIPGLNYDKISELLDYSEGEERKW